MALVNVRQTIDQALGLSSPTDTQRLDALEALAKTNGTSSAAHLLSRLTPAERSNRVIVICTGAP